MTITINLEPEKEARLRQKAARFGQGTDEYIYDLVLERLDEPELEQPAEGAAATPDKEPTLAELFAGRTGLVNSEGRFNYSDHTGKAYTESLLKQKEQKANAKEG